MSKTTINDVAQLLKGDNKKGDSSFWGVVQSLIYNDDDEVIGYNVSIDSDGQTGTIKCNKVVGAKEGDQVFVVLRANGEAVVTSTKGGDADAADAQETADTAKETADEAQVIANQTYVFMNKAQTGSATVINGGAIDTDTLYLGRISTDGQNYAEVNSDGLSVVKSGVPVASFGETVELNGDGSTLSFTNSQLKIEDEDGNEYFNMMFTQGGSMTESFSSIDFTLSGVYTSLTKIAVRLKRGNQIIYPYLECSIGSSTEGIFERSGFIYGTWSRSGSTFHIAIRSASGATFMNAYVVGVAQRGASLNIDGDIANQDGYCIANAVGAGRIMDWGTINISVSGSTKKTGSITFNASFTSPPFVFVTPYASGKVNATVSSVTTSGGTINAWCDDSSSGSTAFRWLAIGVV